MIRAAAPNEIEDVSKIINYRPSGGARAVATYENGLRAMVIFDRWSYNGAEAHIYAAKPGALFNRKFLREAFRYVFEQCDRQVLVAVTPGDSEESLRVSKALGFREIGRIEDYWRPGVPMVVKEMRREDCKWLEEIH